jgi:histidine phosphotransferase ChpT
MAPKLALNLVLLATEVLPRGGEIVVGLQGAGSRLVVSAVASGRDARLPEEVATAMVAPADPPPPLTARTVHGFFTARLAEVAGGKLEAAAQPSSVRLSASIPAA